MEPIHPITMDGVLPHIGKMVCAVCHDGSYYIGKLSNVDAASIYFDGYVQGPGYVSSVNSNKAKAQVKENMKDVKTSAFFNPFFLPFASLAFLFALPFFFFPFFI